MNTFTLHLRDPGNYLFEERVLSFVARDAQGSFGLLANHERMMTFLGYGLAHYRLEQGQEFHIILPGGLLYFHDNTLHLSTRRFYHHPHMDRILGEMEARLQAEEAGLVALKHNLKHLEQEMLRRMRRLNMDPGAD